MFTIDASVWVNADSSSEPGWAASRAFLDRVAAASMPVVVPTLLLVEVAAAISRAKRNAELAREYSERMTAIPFVRWIVLDEAMAGRAAALAADHGLRGADAVYAAVAVTHACELVSLDPEHLTRLTPVLRVRTPSQHMALD